MTNAELATETFQRQLAFGQMAETQIARWLMKRGHAILPIYDIEYDTGKGPRMFCREFEAAAPDLLVWTCYGAKWIEAKHKTVFTWYRIKQQWETGIDLHHYEAYERIATRTDLSVWLLFLHRSDVPDLRDQNKGCPPACPTGLFGGDLAALKQCESHRSNRHGRHGMVYWAHKDLKFLAPLKEIPR